MSNRGLRSGLVGTPERIADRLDRFARAGVDLTLLQFSPQAEEMERFASEVIPLVRPASVEAGAARPVRRVTERATGWTSP